MYVNNRAVVLLCIFNVLLCNWNKNIRNIAFLLSCSSYKYRFCKGTDFNLYIIYAIIWICNICFYQHNKNWYVTKSLDLWDIHHIPKENEFLQSRENNTYNALEKYNWMISFLLMLNVSNGWIFLLIYKLFN